MVEEHIKRAINSLEEEKQSKIAEIKNNELAEKIVAYNMNVDKLANNAIAELESKKKNELVIFESNKIAEKAQIERRYAEEIEAVKQRAIANKENNEKDVVAKGTASIAYEYDKAISKLKEQLPKKE